MTSFIAALALMDGVIFSCACVRGRYDSRDRSPVRYKSRSPLPAHSRSRTPVRSQSRNRDHMKTKSASRSPESPVVHRPRRLLGKTPPLPSRNQSSSPPPRHSRDQVDLKGRGEAPVNKGLRERSRSPLAYSSHKVTRPYTPPSPPSQQKRKSSCERKYSTSPVRKRNSPPPKAYALSPGRRQSPSWSRSRSKSVDRKYSSRSPVRRMDSRSSSSTSPPHYGRSPVTHENSPPAARGRGRGTASPCSMAKHDHSPAQRYHRDYTSKSSRSPEVAKRDHSPMYRRDSSPAVNRRSRSPSVADRRRHSSPDTQPRRTGRSSPAAQTGGSWSQAPKRYEQNRRQSPASGSVSRNGRSPSDHGRTTMRSDRERSSAAGRRLDSSPMSRGRRSPRR